jgi:peptidoglycan/xylan/chitin deacetylase (PgdA/CDA1 family)
VTSTANRTAAYDARVIDELRASGTPATVFLAGLWAETYPDVVRSLAADPRFEPESITFDHAAW